MIVVEILKTVKETPDIVTLYFHAVEIAHTQGNMSWSGFPEKTRSQ